jgi:glycosyltransferase involved in cell wall biosynthesis
LRILAFAYSCEPEKGSEPGAGWIFAQMLANLGEVWVVTRANNREPIEAELARRPDLRDLHFVYVDLPAWARFWKRGIRGARLYYLLWQVAALRRVRPINRELKFDLTWHLTIANIWMGSVACMTGIPFVYGPAGGGTGASWRLLPAVGLQGSVHEIARGMARNLGRYCNPLAQLSWERAQLLLLQNQSTLEWLPKRHHSKSRVFHNVVLEEEAFAVSRSNGSATKESTPSAGRTRLQRNFATAVLAARLLPLKGGELAIRAIARTPGWHLLICGKGPDKARLVRLVERLGVQDRVHFLGWLARAEVFRIMREDADVLLFPSLHDEAGWAIAEAVALGVPVICLDLGGPPMLMGPQGVAVSANSNVADVVARISNALESVALTDDVREEDLSGMHFEDRLEDLKSVLSDAGILSREADLRLPSQAGSAGSLDR